jgi:hypothetical protein
MNAWAASLFDPNFWQAFIRKMVPLDDAMEDRMLASLACRTRLPVARVRELMEGYLRIRHMEIHATLPPGSNAIH